MTAVAGRDLTLLGAGYRTLLVNEDERIFCAQGSSLSRQRKLAFPLCFPQLVIASLDRSAGIKPHRVVPQKLAFAFSVH